MGEPANPTPAERTERQAKSVAIVESVRNDERMPLEINFEASVRTVRAQVEELVFKLTQEITILLEEQGSKP